MKVVIAGGSGFIGKQLTELLVKNGHEVVILSRGIKKSSEKVAYVPWLTEEATPETELTKVDVVVNLAGVSINDGRWGGKHQKQIYDSRMIATEELIRIIRSLDEKPTTFINASAIGIYPASIQKVYTEESEVMANDFLGRTVQDWENKARRVEEWGIRTVFLRFGVVLGNDGGALPLMVLPYKLFVGGTVGSGQQWVSWIHFMDVVRAIVFVMDNQSIFGPVNVTAPNPVRMQPFGKTIASVLNRPHWFPTPAFLMKLVLGKKSKLVLEGQQVLPKVLTQEGFTFLYPTLEHALINLLKK
ncbi:TIGR01777 family oxidoreductase [Caldibacillus lycopersici]|uniref:TIGR01777 family oxidoreductase n=1 Tax=Perspicuibacillus lycopersici TaxID=1325689 RepID=A0AAE3LU00_9BACI|nr:TIGR01777 family oxidoreductase [Perspicuibacillus lycopersici]MCU9614833.1 TIGR01777 family oxidoreductase [Perspicuibacillus lycopersici]